MNAHKSDEGTGDDEDMDGEEAGKGFARDDRAAEHQFDHRWPNDGGATGDGGADSETPIGVLIEAQDLAGEGHSEDHEEEENSDDPSKFAGKFESAEEKDLAHMEQNDRHHKIGAPAVECPDEPAEGLDLVERLETVPGVRGGGGVNESETNSRDELEDHQGEASASENVRPTGRPARDLMGHGVHHRLAELETLVKPPADAFDQFDQAHEQLLGSPAAATLGPCWRVGSCPALMNNSSPSMRYSYSNSPRGGGPEARSPLA